MSGAVARTAASSTCEHCGAHVTAAFARTHGDNDDEAHRCPDCDSWVRISAGSAAGLDVPTPDPQQQPGRSGGRWSA